MIYLWYMHIIYKHMIMNSPAEAYSQSEPMTLKSDQLNVRVRKHVIPLAILRTKIFLNII